MEKKIIIKINKNTGEVISEAVGYIGTECTEAMQFIHDICDVEKTEYKPEYTQDDQVDQIVETN